MMTNGNNKAIVTAIITMAHGLQLKVVAEGVETAEQFHFLSEQKCDEAQGFLFSPPITAEQIMALLPQEALWQSNMRQTHKLKIDII
jgi:EAL domain-containing protein (putative c-di-GMP-specific phosphodiesterase class I)